ncbi:MAG: class I tRNA ligase family protein [Saprospiraceae bacterium]|nr:class I tRNA ligase family protein [Saprospiraceae bacterium]
MSAGWDIIFLCSARVWLWLVMSGAQAVSMMYLTGMVRDKLRRKMSKSLGNSSDALKLIDDYKQMEFALNVGLFSCWRRSLFDEKLCEQGRNFYQQTLECYKTNQRMADRLKY